MCRRVLGPRRLILVSNRGPVEHVVTSDGEVKAQRGSGGVVSALAALGHHLDLTWIAAAMTEGDRRVVADPSLARRAPFLPSGLKTRLLTVPEKVYNRYYNVVSNPFLWFLQHYMLNAAYGPNIDASTRRAWDHGYVVMNRAFAEAIRDEASVQSRPPVVMIQDYQLYLVAGMARELGVDATLQHFVHIPWPAPAYWQFIPLDMRQAICSGLAANDIVGFHTPTFVRNFLNSCEEFLDEAEVDYERQTVTLDGHVCRARAYPISIDPAELRRTLASPSVRRHQDRLRQLLCEKTIVRVDRLEPSKNVLRGFDAYATLLDRQPEIVGKVKFLAFLVPSRTRIPEYRDYLQAVRETVERVNQRFGTADWRPIELFYENNYPQAIAAMSLADVVLVNPIMDGMNLVAKEAPIVSQRNAVLVLSEGAGAHHQLKNGALSIAPGDVEGTTEALLQALAMPDPERVERLATLRRAIESEDITWWIARQVEDIAELGANPPLPWPVEATGDGLDRLAALVSLARQSIEEAALPEPLH